MEHKEEDRHQHGQEHIHKHNHDGRGDHSHGHSHSHGGHNHGGDSNIGTAFFLNLSFTFVELIGGVFTNSVAITSDAVHDLGDSVSLGLAWYFQKLSNKGSSREYSYGYKRFSLLGAIINCAVLLVGSIYILSQAVPRIFSPQETNAAGMFFLAIAGIIVNGAAVLRTREASSINERVVSLHLLEDVLGWVAVLIGALLIRFTGLTVIDPILSVLISAFVLLNVFRNVKQLLPIILQGVPDDIDREHIIEELEEIEEVSGVHDLHIWSLDESYTVLTVHVSLAEVLPPEELVRLKVKIRDILKEEEIEHATIEFEGPGEACGFESCVQ